MLRLKKPPDITVFLNKLSEDGLILEKSLSKSLPGDTDDTKLKNTKTTIKKNHIR